jgi:hypothetical protein
MPSKSKDRVKHNNTSPSLILGVFRIFEKYKSLGSEELLYVSKAWLVNYASIWGFLPYHYDAKTRRLTSSRSRRLLWRWKLNIFLATLVRVLVLGSFINIYSSQQPTSLDKAAMMRIWKLLILLYTIFLHLHTFVKVSEIPGQVNGFEIFHERHKEKCKESKKAIVLYYTYEGHNKNSI